MGIMVRVERDEYGDIVVGRMIGANYHKAIVPSRVSWTETAFKDWFAQQMEEYQPGAEFEFNYAPEVIKYWNL